MHEIVPGSKEGSQEKHIPICSSDGETVTVTVGEAEHPMTAEHYIDWVCIETENGFQLKKLTPDKTPKITFKLVKGEKIKAVYAFCNQHSLWKA